jgi:hypothetical protein
MLATVLIVLLIGYYFSLEFKKNWSALQNYELKFDAFYIFASFCLIIISYLLETFIWKICINNHLERNEVTFPESIAIVNTSGLLKYLPGRIWIYTAQLVWLQSYGISKSKILYANLICILGSITVSLYLGLIYLALYSRLVSMNLIIVLLFVLIIVNMAYFVWNSMLINKLIGLVNSYFKKEIQPLNNSISTLIYIQSIYLCSWLMAGFSGYLLAKGLGLHILTKDMFALLASMSLAWVIGYLAVVSPGGLGIREGMMLLMLNHVVDAQTALLFPILSRIMMLLAEAILGLAAIIIGLKLKVFSARSLNASRYANVPVKRSNDK